ncbi:molybdopterin-binding protein [Streptomyces sp. NPDC057702]|uniref:molybdopterin molybdotransferase MoeA n=1 Tax=unclassified Streptomyces TaxID=2593676 RepID=UPI0036CC2017
MGHGGAAASWPEARTIAARAVSAPLAATATPLGAALGRVLAEPLTALTDLPPFDTSAMDGWALAGPGPWRLPARGRGVLAGHARPEPLADGQAVRIATGARTPPGATAVLRSEHGTEVDPGAEPGARGASETKPATESASAPAPTTGPGSGASGRPGGADGWLYASPAHPVQPGQDIRPRGQECGRGDRLLPAGTLVTPAVVGLAAAAGYDALLTVRRPRAEVLVLGDELLRSGLPHDGLIRDALGPMLGPWLQALGADVLATRWLGDDAEALHAAIGNSPADLVITTGGTAGGPVDHVHPVLRRLGARLLVDGVAVRPGHPMVLARLDERRHLVGLPGNPLAAVSGLLTFAEPLLRTLAARPRPDDPAPGRTRSEGAGAGGARSGGAYAADGRGADRDVSPHWGGDQRDSDRRGAGRRDSDGWAATRRLPVGEEGGRFTGSASGAPAERRGSGGRPGRVVGSGGPSTWMPLADEVPWHPRDTRLVPVRRRAGAAVPLHFSGPAMLRGVSVADGMAVIPPGGVARGDEVEVLGLPWADAGGVGHWPGITSPMEDPTGGATRVGAHPTSETPTPRGPTATNPPAYDRSGSPAEQPRPTNTPPAEQPTPEPPTPANPPASGDLAVADPLGPGHFSSGQSGSFVGCPTSVNPPASGDLAASDPLGPGHFPSGQAVPFVGYPTPVNPPASGDLAASDPLGPGHSPSGQAVPFVGYPTSVNPPAFGDLAVADPLGPGHFSLGQSGSFVGCPTSVNPLASGRPTPGQPGPGGGQSGGGNPAGWGAGRPAGEQSGVAAGAPASGASPAPGQPTPSAPPMPEPPTPDQPKFADPSAPGQPAPAPGPSAPGRSTLAGPPDLGHPARTRPGRVSGHLASGPTLAPAPEQLNAGWPEPGAGHPLPGTAPVRDQPAATPGQLTPGQPGPTQPGPSASHPAPAQPGSSVEHPAPGPHPAATQPGPPVGHPTPAQPGSSVGHPAPAQPGSSVGHPTPTQPGLTTGHPTPTQPGLSASHPTPTQPGPSVGHPAPTRPGLVRARHPWVGAGGGRFATGAFGAVTGSATLGAPGGWPGGFTSDAWGVGSPLAPRPGSTSTPDVRPPGGTE